ncbi:hypothetical protein [Nostoc sp. DSM 114160]
MGTGDWALGIGHWALGIGHWSYQVRLITYYRICAKIPKASSPSKNCGINDKSLAGYDIIGH